MFCSLQRHSRSAGFRLVHAVLLAVAAFADTPTGEILGRVVDVQAALPLEQVTVTPISRDREWERKVQTDAGGSYRFLRLEPGTYSVVAEKEGYYSSERTGVPVRLSQPKVVLPQGRVDNTFQASDYFTRTGSGHALKDGWVGRWRGPGFE